MNRTRRLQVVGSPAAGVRRRRVGRPRRVLEALLLMAAGVGLLVLLVLLPHLIDLDSLLLVSTAIGHLIGGLADLLLGLLQLLAVLLLVALALLALLLLLGGLVRLVRALVGPAVVTPPRPQLGKRRGRP